MTFTYKDNETDFIDILEDYLKVKEGYEKKVYADEYGNPTVGLGHLVHAKDGLKIGDVISDDQVRSFLESDYETEDLDTYLQEIPDATYNKWLGVAHWIWTHGPTDYKTSQLRQHVLNQDVDLNGMLSYLSANWDIHKPDNARVNAEDFTVFYSDTPWEPGFFLKPKNV